MKYKVIMEYSQAEFKTAVENAIHFGWEPFQPATVNSESHYWFMVLRKSA